MITKILQHFKEKKKHRLEESRLVKELFIKELLSPEFEIISKEYGKPISKALRKLYEDKNEIIRDNVTKIIDGEPEDNWIYVCWYIPINNKRLNEQWIKDGRHFAFGGDGSGSEWVVDPTDENGDIYFFEHETGELHKTKVNISQWFDLKDEIERT